MPASAWRRLNFMPIRRAALLIVESPVLAPRPLIDFIYRHTEKNDYASCRCAHRVFSTA